MIELNLIARYSWISISTPFIQVLEYLKKQNIELNVLTDKNQVLAHKEFEGVKYEYFPSLLSKKFPFSFIYNKLFKTKLDKIAVCFDPASLIFGYFFQSYKSYYYVSLELLDKPERGLVQVGFFKVIEFLESIAIKDCKLVIAQSEARLVRLKEMYSLSGDRLRILQNSSAGVVITTGSSYLRDKFHIPKDKKIVLFMGSLMEETGLFDLLDSLKNTSDKYIFVFHGWFAHPSYKLRFEKYKASLGGKIILSEDLLDQDKKYQLIKSADVGCVFFKQTSFNFALGLGSAGKLFDFMRCGIPVICNDSHEGFDIVMKNKLGAVTNFQDLESSLSSAEITPSQNCYRYFEANEFNTKFKKIYEEILEKEK